MWYTVAAVGAIVILIPHRALFTPLYARSPRSRWIADMLRTSTYSPRLLSFISAIVITAILLMYLYGLILLVRWHAFFMWAIFWTYPLALLSGREAYNQVRQIEQRKMQRVRDSAAGELIRGVTGRDPRCSGSFSLWLRPFVSSRRVWVMTSVENYAPWKRRAGDWIRFGDLEFYIARAVEPLSPLVALGRHNVDVIGAGQIEVDDRSWQGPLARAMDAADLIFVVPSARPGISWEISYVTQREALLRKTIFIIPPLYDETTLGANYRKQTYHGYFGSLEPNFDELSILRAEVLATLRKLLDGDSFRTIEAVSREGLLAKLRANNNQLSLWAKFPLPSVPSHGFYRGTRLTGGYVRQVLADLRLS